MGSRYMPGEGDKPKAGGPAGSGSRERSRPGTRGRRPRTLARVVYYVHLWVGVAATAILVILCTTGILLNHKEALGLMPEVANQPSGLFPDALSLSTLSTKAVAAVDPGIASAGIDRMDVRPSEGLVKVRFDDHRLTEVTVDINSGEILNVGERHDEFLEKLHSGRLFGDFWVLVSDAGAVFLLGLLVTGYWLWLYPKVRV